MTTKYLTAEEVWPTGGAPLFKEVHSPYFLPVTEEILAEIVRRIVNKLDPEQIILFGSYAYGTPNQDSDIDLLVIMETNLTHAYRALEVSRLIRPRPFPVDIIVKTSTEVRNALEKGDFFIEEILARGRVLYEQCQRSASMGGEGGRRL